MLLDFDDLLLETYYLLRDNDEVREKYQGSFQSILVDEFQDTNPVQFEILRLLIRENGNPDPSSFWVAGDDHQAIYSVLPGHPWAISSTFNPSFPVPANTSSI